ncbi:uncharacterized protein LOC127746658 [Arachis duranensis]|uniref:Uncharacterized protein LOC127746658 n=1 Tax=Arachis duranensis TaxID=130453 RepID=A0A9C6TW83_ARADU|nr:uncharacterized protein LOC127746658 [Arachis duranensis]
MAEPRWITLHEQGAPDIILQPLQARYPNLDPNFELKSSLINLLPKYHGMPSQDPIRHLKDFQVACSTAQRHGANEVAIMVFAFPFSLEAQAKTWFYLLPDEIATNWDFLRREFLDKFLPSEKTDYIWKKISGIMQRDQESLYEYWSRFKMLLKSCPNHGMNTHLLISYFTGGLCVEDRRLLTTSSGGFLLKNKTEGEVWNLIKDVAKATQHTRVRSNPLKGVVELSPSESSLTIALGDMTTIFTQIQKDQKEFYSIQAIQAPLPVAQLEGPPRICGLYSSTTHYTDQCHQIQEEHALVVANVNYNNHLPYPSQGQNNYPHDGHQERQGESFKETSHKEGTPKSRSKAHSSLGAKPLSKKVKAPAPIDDNEKSKRAKDSSRFTNRFCELVFPAMVERNYHAEHLLTPLDKVAPCVPWEAMDTKAIIPAKGDVVTSGNYLHLPMNKPSLDVALPSIIPPTLSSPPQ